MDNQEVEETFDEQDTGSDNIETGDDEGGDEDNTSNKNKSNFKNLYKKTKEQEKVINDYNEKLATLEAELEEWKNLNPTISEEMKTNKQISSIEEKIFVMENPESKSYLKEIKATMKEYNCDYLKAWKLVKIDLPEESKSKKDFDIGKNTVSKKDLSKVTAEEALELPKEKRREWRKINGYG